MQTILISLALVALALGGSGACSRSGQAGGTATASRPAMASRPTTKPATATATTRTTTAATARRVHVLVSGRVQGVGFRAFTQEQAAARGLGGWVRNLPDGRVEAVVEGPPGKVAELLARIARGPQSARVDKVDVKDQPAQGDLKGFVMRY